MAKFRQPPQSASEATIVSKTIASNGTYYASADSADGYNPVVVEVPGEHATIVSKNIVANGTYNASSDSADGYNPVTVAVPEKVIVSKNITSNGTYNASSDSADGYNPVTVAVPPPALGTKSITSNGTYTASSDNLDGYSQVVVAVSGGALATITVSYSSAFYNKTMTCSKGGTTYTETTTSVGVTVFNVDSSGTWTITCNGVSRTVDVLLEYTTQMSITKTVDVYSAVSDTVSFTDVNGAKTVTTDTSGHGSVSITFAPNSTITFTSSEAKSPADVTQPYSKTITMSENITSIYVMEETALYWWGYETAEGLTYKNVDKTAYTNYLDIQAPNAASQPSYVASNSKYTGTLKAIGICTNTSYSTNSGIWGGADLPPQNYAYSNYYKENFTTALGTTKAFAADPRICRSPSMSGSLKSSLDRELANA